jgi:predicted nucleic acid-binding Zn ribbon protein
MAADPLRNPRGRGPAGPQLIGDLLPRFLEKRGLAAKVEAASVIPEWEDLVGPGIAAVASPLRVTAGTLVVAVATSPWMMELNMMKGDLIRRLNAGKTAGRIEKIVFVMAE